MRALVACIAAGIPFLSPTVQAQTVGATPDPRNFAQLSGSWSYVPFPGGSDATFIDAGGRAQLNIRCNRPLLRIIVSRPATAPAAGMSLWSTDGAKTYPASFDPATAQIRVELAANDSMLDAMVFSRGQFGIGIAGLAPVAFPAWPEAARAIEDCRN